MKVTVVDSGVGNLFSVARGVEYCDAAVEFADTPAQIAAAEQLILPGVGAFKYNMQRLEALNLIDPILAHVQAGKPLLGICVGMQILFDSTEEFGFHQGLGILPGKVVKIPEADPEGVSLKIPHIGWNELSIKASDSQSALFTNVDAAPSVYFVHSYQALPENQNDVIAECSYASLTIPAVVKKANVIGCQFHLEKSGKVGLQLLSNFIHSL